MAALALVDAPVASVDLADVRARMARNRAALAGYFSAERADIFGALQALALTGHHGLLLGPPGTGKSLMVETAFGAFTDGIYRRELLTRQTTESDALAYLDVPVFSREGRYTYRHDGKLPEAHFAFVDEAFKATGAMLNAMLSWLNERIARGGYLSPLISCVGASNEFPEDDTTSALEDRFLARFWVEPLSPAARVEFLRGRASGARAPTLEPITMAELAAARAAAEAIPVDDDVCRALSSVVTSLGGVGVVVSERRAGWCLEYLRGVAWLAGAPAVDTDQLDALAHVLWRRPEDRDAVRAALAAVPRGGVLHDARKLTALALAEYAEAQGAHDFGRIALEHASRLHEAAQRVADMSKRATKAQEQEMLALLHKLVAAYNSCKAAARSI